MLKSFSKKAFRQKFQTFVVLWVNFLILVAYFLKLDELMRKNDKVDFNKKLSMLSFLSNF